MYAHFEFGNYSCKLPRDVSEELALDNLKQYVLHLIGQQDNCPDLSKIFDLTKIGELCVKRKCQISSTKYPPIFKTIYKDTYYGFESDETILTVISKEVSETHPSDPRFVHEPITLVVLSEEQVSPFESVRTTY